MIKKMTQAPRALPLGLHLIYTDGACRTFATALLRRPLARDAHPVTLLDSDGAQTHWLIRIEDDRYVDAEGERDKEDLARAFHLNPGNARIVACEREDFLTSSFGEDHLTALAGILDLLGWHHRAPLAASSPTATDNRTAAADCFEDHGGMAAEPLEMLKRYRHKILMADHSDAIT